MKLGAAILGFPPQTSFSLERFLRHIIQTKPLIINSCASIEGIDADLFYLDADSDNLLNYLHWIFEKRIDPNKLHFISYDSLDEINLVSGESIEKQFSESFRNRQNTNRSILPIFRNIIGQYFKGHGDQSVFSYLGWINYYIGNYSRLVQSVEYTHEDLILHFLKPGLEHWQAFIHRFRISAPILWAAGFDQETLTIDNLINMIINDLAMFNNPDSFPTFRVETLKGITKITELMEIMARRARIGNEETKPDNY
jgi:hypothetical protein